MIIEDVFRGMAMENHLSMFCIVEPSTSHYNEEQLEIDGMNRKYDGLSEEKTIYKCSFCPSQFDRVLSLYGHLNTHKDEVFTCSEKNCKQTFPSLKAFRKHIAGEPYFSLFKD